MRHESPFLLVGDAKKHHQGPKREITVRVGDSLTSALFLFLMLDNNFASRLVGDEEDI